METYWDNGAVTNMPAFLTRIAGAGRSRPSLGFAALVHPVHRAGFVFVGAALERKS